MRPILMYAHVSDSPPSKGVLCNRPYITFTTWAWMNYINMLLINHQNNSFLILIVTSYVIIGRLCGWNTTVYTFKTWIRVLTYYLFYRQKCLFLFSYFFLVTFITNIVINFTDTFILYHAGILCLFNSQFCSTRKLFLYLIFILICGLNRSLLLICQYAFFFSSPC